MGGSGGPAVVPAPPRRATAAGWVTAATAEGGASAAPLAAEGGTAARIRAAGALAAGRVAVVSRGRPEGPPVSWLDSAFHRAMVEAVLVGAAAGLVGVQVVLRRLAFFAQAATHATFPGVVVAAILGINLYLGGAVTGVLVALAVLGLSRRRGHDFSAATGVALAAGFALGVALMSAQNGFTRDLSAYLVGSILTVTTADLRVAAAVAVVVGLALAALGKELVFAAFDAGGARAAGYPAGLLDLLVLLLVEAVVITAVPAVGTILALALLVAPAGAARMWTDRIATMTALAVALGVASAVGGLQISRSFDVAAGGAISLLAAGIFAASLLAAPRHGLLARPLTRLRRPSTTG